MNVLVAFSSLEGQTRKIATFAAAQVERSGHRAVLAHLDDPSFRIDVAGFDRIILAGSVHERRHAPGFEAVLASETHSLKTRPTLLLSVSLNAAFPDGQEEAQDYLDELKLRTGFTPSREALVAGAVRRESYDAYAEQVVQNVLLRDRDTLTASREFTNWDALTQTVTSFLTTPSGLWTASTGMNKAVAGPCKRSST